MGVGCGHDFAEAEDLNDRPAPPLPREPFDVRRGPGAATGIRVNRAVRFTMAATCPFVAKRRRVRLWLVALTEGPSGASTHSQGLHVRYYSTLQGPLNVDKSRVSGSAVRDGGGACTEYCGFFWSKTVNGDDPPMGTSLINGESQPGVDKRAIELGRFGEESAGKRTKSIF